MQHYLNEQAARAAAEQRLRAARARQDRRAQRERVQARAHAARALALTAKRLDRAAARRAIA